MNKRPGDAPRGWTGADEADVSEAAADDAADTADVATDAPAARTQHLYLRTPLTIFLDMVAAALFGLVVARMLLVWFWRSDASGGFKLLVAFVIAAGFLAAAQRVYAFLRDHVHGTSRSVAYAITALGFFGAFVQPMTLAQIDNKSAEAALTKSKADLEQLHETLRARWRADIDRAGAHAPNGTAPPMFSVEDRGNGVRLTSVLRDKSACVVVRRVSPNSDAYCEFRTSTYVLQNCAYVDTEAMAELRLLDSPHDCASWPLEFRVGHYLRPDPSWWSDGALREFDARMPAASVHHAR